MTANAVYYPWRSGTWARVTLLAMLIPVFVLSLAESSQPGQRATLAFASFVLGGVCLVTGVATITSYAETLIVSAEGLTRKTLFDTLEIPFAQVSCVSSRMVRTKYSHFEMTIVEGNGQTIKFPSYIRGDSSLRDYIKQQVGGTSGKADRTQA